MKNNILFFAAIATSSLCIEPECLVESYSKCHNCKPPREQKPTNAEETGKIVIANFLAMFAHFLNLTMAEKDDKAAKINSGMGIAQGIANIATQACKCVELGEAEPEEILSFIEIECANADVDPTITRDLTRAIKRLYWRSALLPQETRGRYEEYAEHSDTSND